jgi:hypothetical protein
MELHGYVAAVDDWDKDEPQAVRPADTNTAQRETADDPPRHPHTDPNPKPEPKGNAAAVLRARSQ